MIRDEPEYLDPMSQKLRGERDSREQLASLKAAPETEGKTVVEDAGHYGDHDTLRGDAVKRAHWAPTDQDEANAVLITTDYRRQHTARPHRRAGSTSPSTPSPTTPKRPTARGPRARLT